MSGFGRKVEYGVFRTRKSDTQCPRVDPCGYRCEAGRGDHEGPHLFEEHTHATINELRQALTPPREPV